MSTQSWQCALVTGGGGGLGKAFARSLINRGKKVYIAGRTESNLIDTAKEIGAAGYFVVDVSELASLPAFANKVISEVPEVDCLINNAGVQLSSFLRKLTVPRIQFIYDFTKGAELDRVHQEIAINTTSLVDLCGLFVPHLMKQEHACIMNIGSGLGYIPSAQVPVYSATKAFVKYFTLSLREQLRETSIKVIEISPPLVNVGNLARSYAPAGEKLDQMVEVLRKKGVVGLTEGEWMAAVELGWDEGKEEIGAGFSQMGIDKWREAFGPAYSMRIAALKQ
ncbi:hypothetical protein FRC09_005358 [Ceratobasidium sp. 395]|nr:hypothetical protein FRC09_005358 [Ceratobasidium sp. 395]